jgi:oxygen-dependent protoporphyrinogen oxidase
MKVVIVGGGIAGLTVAYELKKRGVGPVTLLEARPRLGGTIHTVRENGFLVEGGPDSFIAQKPAAADLCRELGLGDQLIGTSSRRVYVYSRGTLHELPEGMFLTVPTKVWPFLKSGLVSFPGKLRMGMDMVLPRGAPVDDESLGSFVRRRLGREALEKIAEPLMGGIYLADADELSLKSTFPRFLQIEQEQRSLIKAMRKVPAGGGTSPFQTLKGGLQDLVDALVSKLDGVTLRHGVDVRAIERGWKVVLADGSIEADRVVLATPAPITAALLRPIDAALADSVASIKYLSSATVSLGYRRADVARELDGTGFVVPKREGRPIVACTWSSLKFEGRAPEGHLLVRCFFKEPSGDCSALATSEMRELLGAKEPLFARRFDWPGANPVYRVGHESRIKEIDGRTPAGLHLVGSGFRGVGIPDCVRDARAVAAAIQA